MTNREREGETLNFGNPKERGAVEETFYPWDLTVKKFYKEGLSKEIWKKLSTVEEQPWEKYFKVSFGKPVMEYESHMGFDPVCRVKFLLPFGNSPTFKVASLSEWEEIKKMTRRELELYFTDENIEKVYGSLRNHHEKGDYSVRMSIEGFFWIPRELLGIEEHLYAFYDKPELMHDINRFTLEIYQTYLKKVFAIMRPDVIYIQEDLSGKNGPMISPACFWEFVGTYYKELIPMLKESGCGNVFVDTDGDFMQLIPAFMDAGVDGFLPMDVNAGMDIVSVRKLYPKLKFIGAFNKLKIAEGKEAIDMEFERLRPVIRQGGYIPGADHQVAPSTPLSNYRYYIARLSDVMKEACAEAEIHIKP